MASYTNVSRGPPSAQADVPVEGFGGFASRISQGAQSLFAQQRPWGEVFARHAFSIPDSLADALGRIRKNVTYFRVNYLFFLLVLIVLILVWHPESLLVIALVIATWAFLFVYRTQPLTLFGRTFSDKEVIAITGLLTVVVLFFLTDVASLLIYSMVLGVIVICVHAASRVPDDLFIDEQQSSDGVLSFLGGIAPQPSLKSASRV